MSPEQRPSLRHRLAEAHLSAVFHGVVAVAHVLAFTVRLGELASGGTRRRKPATESEYSRK